MNQGFFAARLARRLPFFYGWIVLACVCCVAFARTGPAVATLSLFVGPMTEEFGWSRAALSGAVSLGGILAAITSPMIGSFLDRQGPRVILMAAVLTTSATILALSGIHSLLAFYLLFCIARMNFAGPFDLGTYGAVTNWFVARRPFATSIATLAQMVGLTCMPLIGYWAMAHGGWRSGWIAIGLTVLIMGFIPTWALMVRRPEDLGLRPDGAADPTPPVESTADAAANSAASPSIPVKPVPEEPEFTRAEALATRAFWMLSLYTLLIYPVQAGMSLHQAAHIVERGLGGAAAVTSVTSFSMASALSGLIFGALLRRLGVRMGLAISALLLTAGAHLMQQASTPHAAIFAAILFGIGMGGIHIGLPVAWADYFGRRSFGAIRGVALTIQVSAQASGPLLSGALRDISGDYHLSLLCFAALSGAAALAALLVSAPKPIVRVTAGSAG
ncbi:MAG: MFS transporter [Hyphomicrobiaceae bacterium]